MTVHKNLESSHDELLSWVEDQSDYLYNYALVHFPNKDIAQDLVQETFLAALENFKGFQGKSSPRTWLTSILRHKIIDRIRKNSREDLKKGSVGESNEDRDYFDEVEHWRIEKGPLPWKEDPENVIIQKEFISVLQKCLKKLPHRQREVFLLREFDNLEQKEICNKFDLSPTNCRALLFRSRLHLRNCLNKIWYPRN